MYLIKGVHGPSFPGGFPIIHSIIGPIFVDGFPTVRSKSGPIIPGTLYGYSVYSIIGIPSV